MYTEQFNQTGRTFAMQEALHQNAPSSGAMISQSYVTHSMKNKPPSSGHEFATEEAIGRINAQIDAKQLKKVNVDAEVSKDSVSQIYES